MSVSLLIDPLASLWDNTGSELAFTIEIYNGGTANAAVTFSDSSGLIQNDNPMTLIGGRVTIYATDGVPYKLILKDKSGSTLKTIDNVFTAFGTIAASIVTYDNNTSGLTSTDVQAAIDELAAQTAIDIPYDNTASGLPGTDVQTALDDLNDSNNIDYDNSTSGLSSITVQTAIDELTSIKNISSVFKFDNSSLSIWQRGTTNTLLADNMNGADRWQLGEEATASDTTMVMDRAFNPDITGAIKSKHVAHIEFQIVTGGTSPFLGQRIYDPYFLSGKTVTMSFYINNNSGSNVSCQSRLLPDGILGAAKVTGTGYIIQAAAGYVKYETTITFPTYQSSDIVNDYSNFIVCPLHVPGIGASVDIEIADITINIGSTSSLFSLKSYNEEISDCLPLYQFGGIGHTAGFVGDVVGGPIYTASVRFPDKMIFVPAMTVTALSTSGTGFSGTPVGSITNVATDGYTEDRAAVAFGSGSQY